jgi:predicted permease
VAKNPLIIACLAGAALNLAQLEISPPLLSLMELIAAMALPLGLLAVGVGLDITVLRRGGYSLWLTTLFKLAIYPGIFLLLTLVIDIPAEARMAIVIFTLLPTAPSAYILSKQLAGDAGLMAAIITLQTLVAMISIPLMLMWLR